MIDYKGGNHSGAKMKKDTIPNNSFIEVQLKIVLEHYENARMDGLCHEGAWEVAVSRTKNLHIPAAVLDHLEVQLRS